MKLRSRLFLLPSAALLLATMNAAAQDSAHTEQTREVVTRYLDSAHADLSVMADDVVFINMATGERHTGPEQIREMLHHVYNVAFDAHAERRNLIVDGNHAVLEADIVGTHIGEFAGVAPTNKAVRIPLTVIYDLADDRIVEARIYLQVPAFLAQVK